MGDRQNETKPSALEDGGRAPWEGSGDLALVSRSSPWTCPVASAALPWLGSSGLDLWTQPSPGRWAGPPPFLRAFPTHLALQTLLPQERENGHPKETVLGEQ